MSDDLFARDEIIAVAILVLGVIVARLASIGAGALLGFLERRAARLATTEKPLISLKLIRIIRAVLFWLIVVLAISYALAVLGVGGLPTMLTGVMAFIPQMLVAFTIVVAGHVTGLLASHVVSNLSSEISTSSLAPRLVYGTIVVVAVVMGLQAIRVDISFLTQLLSIAFAVAGAGLMLAFALGARQHVANLLARRELSRLAVTDRIRVDGVEGEVVDIHATGVDIVTEEGVVSVPASRFADTSVLKLTEEGRDG
jgi:small-conductance mechanosensitive channel